MLLEGGRRLISGLGACCLGIERVLSRSAEPNQSVGSLRLLRFEAEWRRLAEEAFGAVPQLLPSGPAGMSAYHQFLLGRAASETFRRREVSRSCLVGQSIQVFNRTGICPLLGDVDNFEKAGDLGHVGRGRLEAFTNRNVDHPGRGALPTPGASKIGVPRFLMIISTGERQARCPSLPPAPVRSM